MPKSEAIKGEKLAKSLQWGGCLAIVVLARHFLRLNPAKDKFTLHLFGAIELKVPVKYCSRLLALCLNQKPSRSNSSHTYTQSSVTHRPVLKDNLICFKISLMTGLKVFCITGRIELKYISTEKILVP